MKTFPLHIGTPDGLLFEGNVEKVICRTITGDLAILAGHSNFCTALGMGESTVVMEDGTRREAAWHRRHAFRHERHLPPSGHHLGMERGHRPAPCGESEKTRRRNAGQRRPYR